LAISLLFLYRSYCVLLPSEYAKYWDYGNRELAMEIQENPETSFVIDQGRKKPTYIHTLFFMQYLPSEYQRQLVFDVENYYENVEFNSNKSFSNLEFRSINWKEDIYKKQILAGDYLAISEEQAMEHFLDKQFEIIAPNGSVSWVGYLTNPDKKCASDFGSKYCTD